MEKANNFIHKILNDNELKFKENFILQGIFCDFFIAQNRAAIIITEKEHDHSEAYFAELKEIEHLTKNGFTVIQLTQWQIDNETDKTEKFLMRKLGF